MVKEDRSGWEAVSPEFQSSSTPSIRPAATAYQLFQKEVTPEVRYQLQLSGGTFDVGQFSRAVRDRWAALDPVRKARFEDLAREDGARFARESHAADVAALERQEQLRKQREELILEDDNGDLGKRSTRGAREKQIKKKEKRERKKQARKQKRSEDDSDSEESYLESESSSDSDDSDGPRKKKAPAPRKVSQAQMARREKAQAEKMEKEQYIAQRQDNLRKDKADQAKRRLEFLLKQSDIFSHFGNVQEDKAKFGSSPAVTSPKVATTDGESRRRASVAEGEGTTDADNVDAQDLNEEETLNTTYLTSQPTTLGFGKMRDYQLEGLNWMVRLQENGVNGILADEMGLGKTLQSISILVYMLEYQNQNGPHLIVVPKSTLSNWMNEIQRWAPSLKAVRFHGNKDEREQLRQDVMEPAQRDENRTWNICVTTYEVCNIEKNLFNKFAWSYLIIDEAHRLKNEASAFSQTIRSFETRYRLLLTGTPLQNNLHELWALLNFLVPDVFANAEQFDEWFNLDIDDADEKNKLISQLHKILRPFMLRRLKADVEKSLPPKHETILYTGMSALQKKLYKDILLRDIDVLQGGGSGGSRTAILNIVMQLRKCAGHPYLFPGVEDRTLPPLGEHLIDNCGKMVLLDKLLKRLRERGHRVLLFTQMTRILDILEDYLVYRHFNYCRIDGNTSYEDREERIDAYNAPGSEKFLFLLSTRAGGLGINLQTADVVILFDSDWNPQADLQAQDRAHRIGQKKEVQVFRFVTEHTIEEKIVERAQQKLKLDAMVVQSGRLKEKDKLSGSELLAAVRFGADKVFKTKDSSITDDDIDLILDSGKRKTAELNEKLKNADKGDLLDFKLDGGTSVQTFEGVDYSGNALARAAQTELLGIMDIGKRERNPVANYNENQLYQQQVAALQGGVKKERKKKEVRLPKSLRLPRMEDWQMYDRSTLLKLQEEEEKAFRSLPEETQKIATMKPVMEDTTNEQVETNPVVEPLPPLLSEEKLSQKEALLSEGFADWGRPHYSAFIKASGKHGRLEMEKIAREVGKPLSDVEKYAKAFWDENMGKKRFSEHEYDRVVKLIERGEKKIQEIKGLERGTRVLVSLFDNPWLELEFTHVNCKDKMFSLEEDRHLLCWSYKYGYGQWEAIKMAIRRSPNFRFDYFLRSLPTELIGRRCEQLMKAAEKEVEQLETKAKEEAGLVPKEDEKGASGGSSSPRNVADAPPSLPMFKVLRAKRLQAEKVEEEAERAKLEGKVKEIEEEMRKVQDRLKVLNQYTRESASTSTFSGEFPDELIPELANLVAKSEAASIVSVSNSFAAAHLGQVSKSKIISKMGELAVKEKRSDEGDTKPCWYLRPEFTHLLDVDTMQFLRTQKEEKLRKMDEATKQAKTEAASKPDVDVEENEANVDDDGFVGPDGTVIPYPEYDGKESPKECKKAFTHFCVATRKSVKSSLEPAFRKDKSKIHKILREKWLELSDEEKMTWRAWEKWDAKRFARDEAIFKRASKAVTKKDTTDASLNMHVPKKRKGDTLHVPKKKKRPPV